MKKSLLTALSLAGVLAANAQVQRLELYEEFTGENCPPCAATNPYITQIITANTTPNRKIVLLRYQTNIPSAPPAGSLYADNSTESNARKTYYSTPFAPYARLDGVELADPSGNGNDGHAGLIDQNTIDNAYLVNSPVSINATHAYNSTNDSLLINITVTAAQNFTPVGTLKLQVALIEEHIEFATAPGTNGEKVFEWVMRDMIPTASGTTMTAGAWTNGQTQSFTLKSKIPTYIKDKNQMAIVAFVQDDGDKSVKNTAYSVPIMLPTDASMQAIPTSFYCSSTANPTVTIKNTGATTLTSATVTYTIDGGAAQVYNFSGSLASGATNLITLPTVTVTAGTHTISATVSSPNGTADINTTPDSKTGKFTNFINVIAAPITEAFTALAFPPANWTRNDLGSDGIQITRAGTTGSASGTGAAKWDFWNGLAGQSDELYLPYTALSNGSQITFYVANAPYTASSPEPDQLDLVISNDCGATWTTVFSKTGSQLNTQTTAATSAFTPSSAAQWRQETVNLSAYDNMSGLLMKFIGTSGYGNNLFVDDVNLTTTLGIQDKNNIAGVYVYPNPANDVTSVKVALVKNANVSVAVYNALGEVVYSENRGNLPSGDNTINLNTASFAKGIYSLVVSTTDGVHSQKLIINR